MTRSSFDHCSGTTRRDLLRFGGLAALGVGLDSLTALRQASAATATKPAKAKHCILIWLDGGPSHLETFDLKPKAPIEVRGPLQPISTKVAGTQVSECLPKTAAIMDQVAIVRSVTSPLGEHNFGTHYMMSGYKPTPVLEYPSFGSVWAHLQPTKEPVLPPHVAVPAFRVGGGRLSGNGFLPLASQPFSLGGDPAKRDFSVRDLDFYQEVTATRLKRRKQFLNKLDQFSRGVEDGKQTPADPQFEQAYRLITSKEAKQAFELEQESAKTRQRYGTRTIGQSCLLARRLVERGVPFVTVVQRGWDTHNNLYTRLKEGYTGARVGVGLIPTLDLAFSSLIQDLNQRGLLDETLIVVMGEFGRTPKLNTQGGRDHWPRVFSVAMAGAGVRGGAVIGSSDKVGEGPQDDPVTPADLMRTIYTLLGVNPDLELHTADGRPVRLSDPTSHLVKGLVA